MKHLMVPLTVAISTGAASAASAADWWMLSRPPAESALFADADTLEAGPDGSVSLRVLRIDREGRSIETVDRVTCRSSDRLSRFACSSSDERDNYGLILAGMDPAEAARMLFDMAPIETDQRGNGL